MSDLIRKNKEIVFEQYRYQLVPNSTVIQQTIDGINSYNDLIREKNNILFNVLKLNNLHLLGRNTNLLYKIVDGNEYCKLIKLGKQKTIDIDTKDFTKETISTYPNLFIFFNNNPLVQVLYIQRNLEAFTSTATVANILEKTINRYLNKWQLSIYIKPILSDESFWDIVGTYEKQLKQISFELIKPNLANISHSLTEDLKNLQSLTNSHTTKLELNAPIEAVLENINPQNVELSNIVDYAKEGGGEMSIKLKGVRKKIKPANVTEISVDEITIIGKGDKQIFDAFTKILCE